MRTFAAFLLLAGLTFGDLSSVALAEEESGRAYV